MSRRFRVGCAVAVLVLGGAGGAVAQVCSDWQRAELATTPVGDLWSVAYGGGRFVAVGWYGGAGASSDDGLVWEVFQRRESFRDVVWTGSEFLAVGLHGVFRSDDGRYWTQVGDPLPSSWGIAIDGDRWIVVGSGWIRVSADAGATWSAAALPECAELVTHTGVALAAGRWVAVSANGGVMVSENGAEWGGVQAPHVGGLWAVEAGAGGLVAVGDGILHSADGLQWEAAAYVPPGTLHDILWTGRRWLAVGDGGLVVVSDDGIAWREAARAGGGLRGLARGGGRIVAVGADSVVAGGDGGGWRVVSETPLDACSMVWIGDGFLALGTDRVTRSADGIAWEVLASGLDVGLVDVERHGDQLVAVGGEWVPDLTWPVTAVSPNGRDWDVAHVPIMITWLYGTWLSSVAVDEGSVVAGGPHGVAATGDGVEWTFTELEGGAGVSWIGDRFVAIGPGTSRVSVDGRAWAGPFPMPSDGYRASAGDGSSTLVVVGRDGRVARTDDGVTWTPHLVPAVVDLVDVAWTGRSWLALGADGSLFSSRWGVSWSTEQAPWLGAGDEEELPTALAAGGGSVVAFRRLEHVLWTCHSEEPRTASRPAGDRLAGQLALPLVVTASE